MLHKLDLNAVFTLYTNFAQNIKFDMALYSQISAASNGFKHIFFNVQSWKFIYTITTTLGSKNLNDNL